MCVKSRFSKPGTGLVCFCIWNGKDKYICEAKARTFVQTYSSMVRAVRLSSYTICTKEAQSTEKGQIVSLFLETNERIAGFAR